ncbi:hypothetical protein FN976_00170 [Caenimonas sedimenti]|uniref:Uncharacterized protein n=1 Tax=Caenimonas sedimenti TaxID=2596921 RepID=A0A562ZY31_9BURK|nr:hypothetical protein [Caenimonas sedimenti]TWO73301.1 hypothetical protein FN976_00170 [Caenimonas sedimenti]
MGRIVVLLVVLAALGVAALLTGGSSLASALVLVGFILGGYAIYRMRAARGVNTEDFFGGAGEDTRLTGLQGGASPSEMPVDRDRPH